MSKRYAAELEALACKVAGLWSLQGPRLLDSVDLLVSNDTSSPDDASRFKRLVDALDLLDELTRGDARRCTCSNNPHAEDCAARAAESTIYAAKRR